MRESAERGVFWSFIDALGMRALQFAIGVFLARLLLPEEFGLIGMLMIFIAVAEAFLRSGFGSALIQKKTVTIEDTSSVFYFNIFMGLLLGGLLYLSAPWIASFYGQPILSSVARGLSPVMLIGSFGIVHGALLTRNIDFKTQTKVSLIAGSFSGLIGITMAYQGFGVWSLVAQQVTGAFLQSLMLWLFNEWRPAFIFSFKSLGQMFSFGSKLLAGNLMDQFFENLYYVVIGKVFTPADLGFYVRAKTLQELPSGTLSGIVVRVSFPLFSKIQDDKTRLMEGLRKALRLVVFVNTPMMVGLAVVAEPFVLVVFTDKWLPCVPYLQLMTVLGVLVPLHFLNLNTLIAMGRSDLFLRVEIIKKLLIVGSILITYRIGIVALILGQIAVSLIAYFVNTYHIERLLQYGARKQLRDLWKTMFCAAVMGAAVHLTKHIAFPNPVVVLGAQVTFGVGAYLGLAFLFKLQALSECWDIIGRRIGFQKALDM